MKRGKDILTKLRKFAVAMMMAMAFISVKAEVIEVDPIFEYPIAPEEIPTLTDKSNWIMQHFWDNMDFKNKEALNQAAVNDAVRTYCMPMQFADKVEVDKGVDKLIAQLTKNPTLLVQFTKGFEEALYSNRAILWIDEVYMKVLDAFLKNKKLSAARKARYQRQLKQLQNTKTGEVAPTFKFTTPTGNPGTYEPIGVFTIIEFGNPDCDDCRHAKLRMETDVAFSSLVDKGLVNILFITPDPEDGWQSKMTGFPTNWVIGASDTVADELDIRITPSFFVVGKDGKLMAKNISVEQAMNIAKRENLEQ